LPLAEGVDCLWEWVADPPVLVGRTDALPELIALALTVSEVHMVKHAYEQGVKARRGIEY
jgi:cob(I)alamin adenosyltransferase